jgi:DNA repair protein SbcD/Mre11
VHSYKILHAADLHIDSPLRGLEADSDAPVEKIRGATRAAFSNLVDFALDQNVALVLIAGDLYDGDWQDWRTGQFLVRELERLTRTGIRVVAISGNHDAESVLTKKLRWPEGARLLRTDRAETIAFPELGLAVHGRGFATRAVTENLVPGYPEPVEGMLNIGMLHTSATGRAGHENYAPCSVEQMRAREYQYWALGHVHEREILARDPWIVFPGNVQGRHINEPGAKGVTVITVEGRKIVGEPAHHALDVVRWKRIDCDLAGAADEEEALSRIRHEIAVALEVADGRMLAARLRLTGATPAHAALARDAGATREKIRGEALAAGGADVLWLEQVEIATTAPASVQAPEGAVALLLRQIEAADTGALVAALQPYAASLLDRATGLRDALGEQHPALLAAAGTLDPDLLEQARMLLLARLGG